MEPDLGSMLLGSRDPDRLRAWYGKAFGISFDGCAAERGVGLIIDHRDDVAELAAEPGRVILNFHVDDARAAVDHLDDLGVTWVAELEERNLPGMWFATCLDPDGNYVQVVQLPNFPGIEE